MGLNFGSFLDKEYKYLAADGLLKCAAFLTGDEAPLEADVAAVIPQGVSAVLRLIEKDDLALGPIALFINAQIGANILAIDGELAALLADGGAVIPKVAAALTAVATKLQAEAAAE